MKPEFMKYGFFLILLLLLFGCSGESDTQPVGHIVSTAPSPSKTSKAFVLEPELKGGLGATVSQPYQVWIQSLRPGMGAEKMLVFEADKTEGIHLSWTTERRLEICYSEARIVRFRNRFVALDTKNQRVTDEVEVVLKRVPKLAQCE